ncbi:MAG: VanZ family protein [bacterium]
MKKILYIASILYLVILFILMLMPLGDGSVKINNTFIVGFRGDYLLHILVYTPWLIVGKILLKDACKPLLWIFLGVIVAVALEFSQMWLPYRGFNINDLIFSVVGVFLSSVFYWLLRNYFSKR